MDEPSGKPSERGFINKDTALSAYKNSVSQNESRVNPCLKIGWALIILSLYLEVSLWVIADGALLWCLLANHDMTTVRALPDDVAVL